MDIEKTANELIEELNKELSQSQRNNVLLEGAIQGIRLLFQKLNEEQVHNEEEAPQVPSESNKPSGGKKEKKS